MLSDTVKTLFALTPESVATWLADTRARLRTVACQSGTNLGHLDVALTEELRSLGAPLLGEAAQIQAAATPLICPTCQQSLLREAKHCARQVTTTVGPVWLTRDYGWCPQCHQWHFPADVRWGLHPKASASPRVQEIAAESVLKMPCAQAHQSLPRLGGCPLSAAGLHREALRQGARALAIRQEDLDLTTTPQGVAQLSRQAPSSPQPFVLIIQMDAWNIRERTDWGRTEALRKQGQEPVRWHWVYTATIFRLDQRGHTAGRRPVITERGYVATRAGLESFERQVYAEALRRGLGTAVEVLVVADGALWIWNLVQNRFRLATQRVDLYHVKQHLWSVANELYVQNRAEARAWLRPLFHQLERKNDGAAQVLGALQELLRAKESLTPAQREKLAKEIGYFTTHAQRMDYAQGRRKQQPVGSGAIESTCRQYQVRFKRVGQFWSLAGDEALLALETLNRNGRWHELFPHNN